MSEPAYTTDARHAASPKGRLAYLATTSGLGGAEQQVRALAREFRGRGWDVGVISMLPLEPLFADLRTEGIRAASLSVRRGVPDPRAIVRLARLLQRWRPDVLHSHMVHANLLARITRLVMPVPVVISTIHNEDEGAQWRYVAYRVTARLADATTAVSRAAVEASIRRGAAGGRSIDLMPNGIRIDRASSGPVGREALRTSLGLDDAFAWLAVGRLTEAKAYPDLVQAFAMVLERRPDARLLIAGEGPLAADLRRVIDQSRLADRVALLGRRDDVAQLMAAADAFVLASAWEGLPMVLLEAAVTEMPIVATDVGGTRDVLSDGVSGLVTPRRVPAQLAARMLQLMAMSPHERAAMGAAARSHAEARFAMANVADLWEELYCSLLAERGAG